MVKKAIAITALAFVSLSAGDFNAQAEKDRKALIKYFETKFADPAGKSRSFFPYVPEEELKKNYIKGLKWQDFSKGSYSYAKAQREQYEELIDVPPYDDNIDNGEELYNKIKGLKKCFPDPAKAAATYPKFDQKKKEVITLTGAINDCIAANGGKKLNPKKGKIADIEAYFASQAREKGLKLDIKIPSKEAQAAYEHGKKYYYSQRGYIKLSCANCHVQGAGQRVRNEYLSPLLGQTTHFPVYRLKWQGLGTLERRMGGCIKNQGQQPPKPGSKDMRDLIYFLSYMSNGMKIDGPDVRK